MKVYVLARSFLRKKGVDIVGVYTSREIGLEHANRQPTDGDEEWAWFEDEDGVCYFDTMVNHMELTAHDLTGVPEDQIERVSRVFSLPAGHRMHKAVSGPHISDDLAGVICGRDGVEHSTIDDALVTCKDCKRLLEPRCVRCGAPYTETGTCSRRNEGCQGGRGESR